MLDDSFGDARLPHELKPRSAENRIQVGEELRSVFPGPCDPVPRFEIAAIATRGRWAVAAARFFGDALAAGRVAHGERWDFDEVDSRMEIFLRRTARFFSTTEFVRRVSIPSDWVSRKDLAIWQLKSHRGG